MRPKPADRRETMTQAAVNRPSAARYLFASGEPEDGGAPDNASQGRGALGRELDYRVELWDTTESHIEQVLAVTAHGSIGYAAYYAAIKEYPERHVVLRHKGGILSRSGGRRH
jgi:hypothetical protein